MKRLAAATGISHLAPCVLAIAFLLVAAPSPAQDTSNREEQRHGPSIHDGAGAWSESTLGLPPFPKADDLEPVDLPVSGYAIFVDRNSISVGTDDVLRYTVIISPDAGSANILHEGIRCSTHEVKIYAFGTREGRFRPVRDPRWRELKQLPRDGPMSFHREFARQYACHPDGGPRTPENLQRLVAGMQPKGIRQWTRATRDQ